MLKQKRDGVLDGPSDSKWDSAFWKESKDQLLKETSQKCAYCETPTKVNAFGDVEHFRPKSVYWWLAYSYENYLASCTMCNQKYKKDFFSLENDNLRLIGPVVDPTATDAELKEMAKSITVDPVNNAEGMDLLAFVAEHKAEKPLLINPYSDFDDPAIYLKYQPILSNKEVVVIPTKPKYVKVVKACEDLFGINRSDLMNQRFERYVNYMTYKHLLNDPGISANTRTATQNRLIEYSLPISRYAGMIRFFETVPLADLPWDFNIRIDQ